MSLGNAINISRLFRSITLLLYVSMTVFAHRQKLVFCSSHVICRCIHHDSCVAFSFVLLTPSLYICSNSYSFYLSLLYLLLDICLSSLSFPTEQQILVPSVSAMLTCYLTLRWPWLERLCLDTEIRSNFTKF